MDATNCMASVSAWVRPASSCQNKVECYWTFSKYLLDTMMGEKKCQEVILTSSSFQLFPINSRTFFIIVVLLYFFQYLYTFSSDRRVVSEYLLCLINCNMKGEAETTEPVMCLWAHEGGSGKTGIESLPFGTDSVYNRSKGGNVCRKCVTRRGSMGGREGHLPREIGVIARLCKDKS